MKISSILESVAAKYESRAIYYDSYSCPNIEEETSSYSEWNTIITGLEEMGLPHESFTAFKEFEGKDKAKARMLWLTWAAMMAREQGL